MTPYATINTAAASATSAMGSATDLKSCSISFRAVIKERKKPIHQVNGVIWGGVLLDCFSEISRQRAVIEPVRKLTKCVNHANNPLLCKEGIIAYPTNSFYAS